MRPVAGLFQFFVPFASPMKFDTPIGALSGKSVQVMFPAVVSMIAVGWAVVVAGFAAGFEAVEVLWWVVAVCAATGIARQHSTEIRYLRMSAPERKTEKELYDRMLARSLCRFLDCRLQFSNYAVSSIRKAANLTATNPHVFM